MIYTEPGFYEDLDLWVDPSEGNALAAVFFFPGAGQFGAPASKVSGRRIFTSLRCFTKWASTRGAV